MAKAQKPKEKKEPVPVELKAGFDPYNGHVKLVRCGKKLTVTNSRTGYEKNAIILKAAEELYSAQLSAPWQ